MASRHVSHDCALLLGFLKKTLHSGLAVGEVLSCEPCSRLTFSTLEIPAAQTPAPGQSAEGAQRARGGREGAPLSARSSWALSPEPGSGMFAAVDSPSTLRPPPSRWELGGGGRLQGPGGRGQQGRGWAGRARPQLSQQREAGQSWYFSCRQPSSSPSPSSSPNPAPPAQGAGLFSPDRNSLSSMRRKSGIKRNPT